MSQASRPASNLIEALSAELAAHAPFASLESEQRRRLVVAAQQIYAAPGEVLIEPAHGVVDSVFLVRSGEVACGCDAGNASDEGNGNDGNDDSVDVASAGDLFPLAEALRAQPVRAAWRARTDTFCLRLPLALVRELAAASPAFADFVHQRVLQGLTTAQRRLQTALAQQALVSHSLAQPLSRFVGPAPLALPPQTALGDALRAMIERDVGSVLVVDDSGAGLGILTRHDLPRRVVLAQRGLDTPLADVMSQPLTTLSGDHSAHDAALLMASQRLRHVPITAQGRVVGIVSERDLFALQRLSLRQVTGTIDAATQPSALKEAAADIRRLTAQLFAQGVQSRSITALISSLNDRLTSRLVALLASRHGLDLTQACWLAFGSEGRSEQTVATDQDNGIVFSHGSRDDWLALGGAVNQALADFGYPLCKGGIMAGNPDCCRSGDDWRERFDHWISHGSPQDLLHACIFFDMRPIAGQTALAAPLRRQITERAAAAPRFLRQLAEFALQRRPPLRLLGGIAAHRSGGHRVIDLKHQGGALFVDAARLLALGHGVAATSTRDRLLAAGTALGVPDQGSASWVAAFEHVQLLRLHAQLSRDDAAQPNDCRIDLLNDLDRRMLRESLRIAHRLQQRIQRDYLQ